MQHMRPLRQLLYPATDQGPTLVPWSSQLDLQPLSLSQLNTRGRGIARLKLKGELFKLAESLAVDALTHFVQGQPEDIAGDVEPSAWQAGRCE